MSAQDTVPTPAETATDHPNELEEWLIDSFEEIAELDAGRRAGEHDNLGFYAELAGSPGCLARGHFALVSNDHPLFEEWADAHPMSWDGERLCEVTKYATACTACESDCGQFFEPVSLWSLPGVAGRRR